MRRKTKTLLISVPVEPWGDMKAMLADWLIRACVLQPFKGWSVRHDIVHDKPVAATRNRQVRRFLESDNDYVLFIDDDMVPSNENVQKLLDYIEDDECDAICGIADQQTKGGPMPVIYKFEGQWDKCSLNDAILRKDPEAGPFYMENSGTGAACILAKRSTLDKIGEDGRIWFKDVLCEDAADERFGGRIIGHDAWFFVQMHELGLKPYIHTDSYWGHIKPGDLRNESFRIQAAMRGKALTA